VNLSMVEVYSEQQSAAMVYSMLLLLLLLSMLCLLALSLSLSLSVCVCVYVIGVIDWLQ
jgi:hypothetical protein